VSGQTPEAYVWARGRWRVRAGEWVLHALAMVLRVSVRLLPVWWVAAGFAPVGGWVALGVPGFRRRAAANLALIHPEMAQDERRRLIRDAGRNFARLMVEYAHLDRLPHRAAFHIEGAEHLAAARASGRGVVLVTAHYGNWEAIRLAARRSGHDSGILYRAFNNRYLDRYISGFLETAGTPVLHKGRAGMRALVGHLQDGGVMLILVDQRNSGAPFLPFLGHPAETVTAAAALAHKTGAALIPAVARRDIAGRRFDVRFEAPLDTASPLDAMTRVNAQIGAWIGEDPAQWFWFHRRWRSTSRSQRD
jgi:KDO2-lipid IV(A) lauroyltransferase